MNTYNQIKRKVVIIIQEGRMTKLFSVGQLATFLQWGWTDLILTICLFFSERTRRTTMLARLTVKVMTQSVRPYDV